MYVLKWISYLISTNGVPSTSSSFFGKLSGFPNSAPADVNDRIYMILRHAMTKCNYCPGRFSSPHRQSILSSFNSILSGETCYINILKCIFGQNIFWIIMGKRYISIICCINNQVKRKTRITCINTDNIYFRLKNRTEAKSLK